MNNKNENNPQKLSLIIIIIIIFIIIGSIIHRRSSYTEEWLICEYPTEYTNYTELQKFRFKDGILIGYYRQEELDSKDLNDFQERYKYFMDIKEDLNETDNFSYDVKKDGTKIHINTFIDVSAEPEYFNSFIKDLDIDYDDRLELIQLELESLKYTCKVTKK